MLGVRVRPRVVVADDQVQVAVAPGLKVLPVVRVRCVQPGQRLPDAGRYARPSQLLAPAGARVVVESRGALGVVSALAAAVARVPHHARPVAGEHLVVVAADAAALAVLLQRVAVRGPLLALAAALVVLLQRHDLVAHEVELARSGLRVLGFDHLEGDVAGLGRRALEDGARAAATASRYPRARRPQDDGRVSGLGELDQLLARQTRARLGVGHRS